MKSILTTCDDIFHWQTSLMSQESNDGEDNKPAIEWSAAVKCCNHHCVSIKKNEPRHAKQVFCHCHVNRRLDKTNRLPIFLHINFFTLILGKNVQFHANFQQFFLLLWHQFWGRYRLDPFLPKVYRIFSIFHKIINDTAPTFQSVNHIPKLFGVGAPGTLFLFGFHIFSHLLTS